jgi:hypothetical protein
METKMMMRLVAVILVFTVACGTVLNGGPATIIPPPGATIDGVAGPVPASKKISHEVVYPDGRRCIVESGVSAGYLIVDVVLLFLVGVVVDAITGDWKVLNADACPGVIVN